MISLLNADTNALPYSPQSNFQAVQLSTFDSKGYAWWGAVSQFQIVDREFLRSLQHDKDGFSVQQKMNWLGEGSERGRPYFEVGENLAFGTIVFGGQLIRVESENGKPVEYWRRGKYPNQSREESDILFYKLQGIRRADFSKGYTYDSRPYLIQRATSAYPGNAYVEFSRGEIFHPVWDTRDFSHNERTRDAGLYIAAAFLEPL